MTCRVATMDGSVDIVKVDRSNMKDFLRLIGGLARYERAAPPDDAAKARLEADALSADPPFRAFVTYIGDKPIGYIIHHYTYSTYDGRRIFFLEDLFVTEDARKKGVGKEMFRFCLDEAKRQNCCEIQWAVLTWNEDAIGFYERMGGKRLDLHAYVIGEKDFDRSV
jgi:GNAT superfamily N-acetyltransferase